MVFHLLHILIHILGNILITPPLNVIPIFIQAQGKIDQKVVTSETARLTDREKYPEICARDHKIEPRTHKRTVLIGFITWNAANRDSLYILH